MQRLSLTIQGTVQGVGFRPFVYRLAKELCLSGFVSNNLSGVLIEIEGIPSKLELFLERLVKEKPVIAEINSITQNILSIKADKDFLIFKSEHAGNRQVSIPPDIATCQSCLEEIFNKNDRRYNYPFTNCTNCGPRFSIIEKLPYDRSSTTMKDFLMCKDCKKEYINPLDRRFHAQPNACPNCGPELELWDSKGKVLAKKTLALDLVVKSIQEGKIVAIKNTGGFHLIVDAYNNSSVIELRRRKYREEKPFALLYPSLKLVEKHTQISDIEKKLLTSNISPIVLLKKREQVALLAKSVAPDNPYLGIMLANSPLQHLLMDKLKSPVVATSGNLAEEPICIDNLEAIKYLANIADFFLVHNRPIVQPIDDSIVQVVLEEEMVLRRARGYSNLLAGFQLIKPGILAVGGQLKNTVALSIENGIYLSQHIGDLHTEKAFNHFEKTIEKFTSIYNQDINLVVYDSHPEYLSAKYGKAFSEEKNIPSLSVQHHHSHALSCMLENNITENCLAVIWDGAGYGLDGKVWGGEFFKVKDKTFSKIAHLREFPLIGGEKAIKEPRRVALTLLYKVYGEEVFNFTDLPLLKSFTQNELTVFRQMLKQKNLLETSSIGRLFDALAAILNLVLKNNFEAQAAMKLEFLVNPTIKTSYHFALISKTSDSILVIDWQEMIKEVLSDLRKNINLSEIATKFHNALVKVIVEVAKQLSLEKVVLSGGCFQNRYLLENTVLSLRKKGFYVYWSKKFPINDGGISLGQILTA